MVFSCLGRANCFSTRRSRASISPVAATATIDAKARPASMEKAQPTESRPVEQTNGSSKLSSPVPASIESHFTKPTYMANHALLRFRNTVVPLERYLYLRDLQVFNPTLYFKLLRENTEEVLPYVYTPTVGEACEKYHSSPIPTNGIYISLHDKGQILEKLKAFTSRPIRVVVVTDGERILGLGDLGANGMGISEGKIQLYTAIGGVSPEFTLPICIDVGTNNKNLLEDPAYKGIRNKRITGAEYDEFVGEFMDALQTWQPHIMVQFEDFGNTNAFRLLDNYRYKMCCFNDDIQGTAAITISGIMAALRCTGKSLKDQRVLFYGAGEAGTGIGDLFSKLVHKKFDIPLEEARKQCFFIDSLGLVCKSRKNLQHHKLPFAHDVPFQPSLLAAVKAVKPTVLIGVSTVAKSFTEEIVRLMASYNERPIIMPLSNPTSKSECTFQEAFDWTEGRIVFASGSPFPIIHNSQGLPHHPAQANNAYIYPAIGHSAALTQCNVITDDLFLVAAEELAQISTIEEIESGFLFPSFSRIKSVNRRLITKVCEHIIASGLGRKWTEPATWDQSS